MAKRRTRRGKHRKKNLDDTDADDKETRKSSQKRRSSRPNKRMTKEERFAKKRREDIIFFSVLFIIVASIFSGYFIYDVYFKDGDDGLDFWGGGSDGTDKTSENIVEVGEIAPYFELTDLDGRQFSLDEYLGQIVILDFMADYCPPCHVEMNHLRDIYRDYNYRDVEIISIDVADTETAEQVRMNLKEHYDAHWRFAAKGESVGTLYGVEAIPTIFIIDQGGIVSFKNTGITDFGMLMEELNALLGSPA